MFGRGLKTHQRVEQTPCEMFHPQSCIFAQTPSETFQQERQVKDELISFPQSSPTGCRRIILTGEGAEFCIDLKRTQPRFLHQVPFKY